jgi:Resolvase, N terminal domain
MGKAERSSTASTLRGKRVALYVRVSTDGQSVANQQRELEAVAQRHGWNIAGVFSGPRHQRS